MNTKSIRLKNGYKRFHDLTIDLGNNPPRIVALVGPNRCGKSIIFDGMIWRMGAHQAIGNEGRKNADFHSMDQDNTVTRNDVEIEYDIGDFNAAFNARSQTGNVATMFSFRSSYRYNTDVKIKETKENLDIALNQIGAASSAAIDAKMEDSYRRLQAEYRRLVDEDDLNGSGARAKIVDDLNASLKNCLDIEIVSLGNVEGDRGTLYFRKSDQVKQFEFNFLSAGEKEVVDLLLDLYLRRVDYIETIFLIDEPELHISTAIQKKLLIEIDKLIGENCQLWVSTHSIGLLRALQDELNDKCEVIHFDPDLKLGSETAVLTPMAKNRRNWQKIFATAIDDLASLVSPRQIIVCEGRAKPKSDGEGGLDANVFNTIFGETFDGTHFVSGGGETELEERRALTIEILSKKVLPDLEVLVLKDRDLSGKARTSQADRAAELQRGGHLRMLIRAEIENYLFDKEVLRAFCASIGAVFQAALYHDLISDIENDDIKALSPRLKIEVCGDQRSLSKDNFKRELAKVMIPEMAVYQDLYDCIFGDLARCSKPEERSQYAS